MFLYYIVRTLQTHIRKYMGTKNKKCPDIKGISVNPTFFDSLNPFALFLSWVPLNLYMGTIVNYIINHY